jgi:predicted ribosome quality control (RQC) complex YloA/Tae2 family protein
MEFRVELRIVDRYGATQRLARSVDYTGGMMSLNWKEIDLALAELDLAGGQIQKVTQSAYDVLNMHIRLRGKTRNLLIVLSPGVCRLHETFRAIPKNDKPLRFAEFLKSRLVNGWISEAVQLGDQRIIRLVVRHGEENFRIYIRLWSNAANVIVTDTAGAVLDAMRRLPKRGEVSGGYYAPEAAGIGTQYACTVREFSGESETDTPPLSSALSFNEKIDRWYAEHGKALSLESLREQARRLWEGRIGKLGASLDRLREKERDFSGAERLKEYGDIIMANLAGADRILQSGGTWLEADDFYHDNERIRISLAVCPPGAGCGAGRTHNDAHAAAVAAGYFTQYHKARSGLDDVRREIEDGEAELRRLEDGLAGLFAEDNPLRLAKLLKAGGEKGPADKLTGGKNEKNRPGLAFRRGDWLLIVGRSAAENDTLLRRYTKGNDIWLHARDFAGSYVFIKQRAGKSVPLDILLDAGHLALFYSKGRNNGKGSLYYTPVKYLRRAKNGPKGLVLPTQEKNLDIVLDEKRLRELETCRVTV